MENCNAKSNHNCLVCKSEVVGTVCGLDVCQACATFFRRSIRTKKIYKCRRGTRDCDLDKNNKAIPLCRFCRLQKCYDVGMKYAKNRPEICQDGSIPSSSDNLSKAEKVRNELEQYFSSISHEMFVYSDDNIETIVENIKNILRQPFPLFPHHAMRQTPTLQLLHALQEFHKVMKPLKEDIVILDVADKVESFRYQENYAIKVAELYMGCEVFAKLPFEDRYKLFCNSWRKFFNIERLWASYEIFGYDSNIIVFDHKTATELNAQWHISTVPPEKSKEYMKFCTPLKDQWINSIGCPLRSLKLTEFEIVYILLQLMWNTQAVMGLAPETIGLSRKILDDLETELHEYYSNVMKLDNYISRHGQIMRLIVASERHVHLFKEYMTLAKIFNIFENQLYISELIK